MIVLCGYVKKAIYAMFIFLGIKTGVVEVLFYLMCTDTILGIIKTVVLKNVLSFKILAVGMVSKISIIAIPLIIALMGKGLNFDLSYFVVATMNVLIVNEGISCITNVISIKGKKEIENKDYLTRFLNKIRGALSKLI